MTSTPDIRSPFLHTKKLTPSDLVMQFIFTLDSLLSEWPHLLLYGMKRAALSKIREHVLARAQPELLRKYPSVVLGHDAGPQQAAVATQHLNNAVLTAATFLAQLPPTALAGAGLSESVMSSLSGATASLSNNDVGAMASQPVANAVEVADRVANASFSRSDPHVHVCCELFGQPSDPMAAATSSIARPSDAVTFRELLEVVAMNTHELELELSDIVLGRGSFGEVLQGTILSGDLAGTDVAVKRVAIDAVARRKNEFRDMANEIELLANLKGHRNLVQLYDVQWHEPYVYLVMELCSGSTLIEFLEAHPELDLDDMRGFTAQILWGLFCLHENNVIHRDLKPANILVAEADDGAVLKLAGVWKSLLRVMIP